MTVIKICQSYGTPIKINGTNSDGSENQDCCRYCFENGQFTSNATMEEMIQHAPWANIPFAIPPNRGNVKPVVNLCSHDMKKWGEQV